jgi:large subunit ribosomal protein L37Ae
MAKGTKKAGITGKYGPRYGVKVRKRIKSVSRHRSKPQRCPECQHDSVRRVDSGIWECRHCHLKFAASAYSTRTRSFIKEEAVAETERFVREDAADLEERPELITEEGEEESLAQPKPELLKKKENTEE